MRKVKQLVVTALLSLAMLAVLPASIAQAHTQYTYDNCSPSGYLVGTRNTWGHEYFNAAGKWAVSLPQLWVNRSSSGPVWFKIQVYNYDLSLAQNSTHYDSDGSWAGNIADAYTGEPGGQPVIVAVQTSVWADGPYCNQWHYEPQLHV